MSEFIHSSQGYVTYGPGITCSLILYDSKIIDYYYSLIPKYYYASRQKYRPHITIVRLGLEKPKRLFNWGKYAGKELTFRYSPIINMSDRYFWLEVECRQIGEIRKGLGLPEFRFEDRQCYHITIANKKRDFR